MTINQRNLRTILGSLFIIGLWLAVTVPSVFSQEVATLQNLIVNGGFEQGFQEQFGVGYGWGAFSNGNAAVGWNSDSWAPIVIAGKYAQLIEIKNATDRDRYAGIYQTVAVVPGQPYKLTIKGLVRSAEGDIVTSDYGYRLQYGIDYEGGTAWELVPEQNWQEIPWDEQPLSDPPNGVYRFETFETTLTAKSDKLTLFIRAWKKWLNDGSGLYDLDEISLVGPAPEDFQATTAQAAAVGNTSQSSETEFVSPDPLAQVSEHDGDLDTPTPPPPTQPPATLAPPTSPTPPGSQLPVSGQGRDWSINIIVIMGVILLLVLLASAITTTVRRGNPLE
jgi:hypothetical protein